MPSGSKKIAGSALILLAENIFRMGMVAATSFWIARQLGPADFGVLNFASAFVAILMAVGNLGLETPITMILAKKESDDEVLYIALIMRLIAGLFTYGLAFSMLYGFAYRDRISTECALIISTGLIFGAFGVFDYWFKARTEAIVPAIVRVTATLLSNIAKISCLVLGLGLHAISWAISIEVILISLGLFCAYRKLNKNRVNFKKIHVKRALDLFRSGWPYMLGALLIMLYMKIDVVLMGYMAPKAETGIYALSQKLSEVLYIVPTVLIQSIYPHIVKKIAVSNDGEDSNGQLLFDFAMAGSFIVLIFSYIFVGPIIDYIFGQAYESSVNVFYIHGLSVFAIALNSARSNWMAVLNVQNKIPMITFLGLLMNLVMNYLLIPDYGAMGAAAATLVSYFFSGYLISYFVKDLKSIFFLQTKSFWPWARIYSFLYKIKYKS